jgi:hypothetical protein
VVEIAMTWVCYTGSVPATDSGPELLYHYTDARGLYGILTSGELRATEALYLNDASELDYVFLLLAEVLDGFVEGNPPLRASAQDVVKMLRLGSEVQRESWRNDFLCFVACFCEDKDLLSQWRGYANGVGGYCIGFKRREIESIPTDQGLRPYKFERVDYDAIGKKAELTKQLLQAVEASERHAMSNEGLLQLWNMLMGDYFGGIGFYAPLCKSPGFAEEKEWRIITPLRRADLTGSDIPKFRTTIRGLVPYVVLDVRGDDLPRRALIGEIVIGPAPHPELAERSLRLLLASIGYEEKEVLVTRSKIPLRA